MYTAKIQGQIHTHVKRKQKAIPSMKSIVIFEFWILKNFRTLPLNRVQTVAFDFVIKIGEIQDLLFKICETGSSFLIFWEFLFEITAKPWRVAEANRLRKKSKNLQAADDDCALMKLMRRMRRSCSRIIRKSSKIFHWKVKASSILSNGW